jgi:outer membrane protein TolC
LDFDRSSWSAGVDTDLGLDRKAERNAYRASLIAVESTKRDLELAEDQIKLDVREAWRALEQEKTNFEINQKAVALNERRVEEQNLRFELGLGVVIDQVDAENDLINSQNGLTNSLISHTIARLQFWQDIGVLFIKENGQWEEVTDVHAEPS